MKLMNPKKEKVRPRIVAEPKLQIWLTDATPDEILETAKLLEFRAYQCRMVLAIKHGHGLAKKTVVEMLPRKTVEELSRN